MCFYCHYLSINVKGYYFLGLGITCVLQTAPSLKNGRGNVYVCERFLQTPNAEKYLNSLKCEYFMFYEGYQQEKKNKPPHHWHS